MRNNLYDYLFVMTDKSEAEGEEFLVEETSLENAKRLLIENYDFKPEEFRFIERMSVEEGEWLGLDTY